QEFIRQPPQSRRGAAFSPPSRLIPPPAQQVPAQQQILLLRRKDLQSDRAIVPRCLQILDLLRPVGRASAGGCGVKSTKAKPGRPNQSTSSRGLRAEGFIAPIFMENFLHADAPTALCIAAAESLAKRCCSRRTKG